jgi:broad specificity polyphosphatase/5'/3'-nucleotidase SurE
MDGYLQATGDVEETDLEALKKGFVSLTPIHFDLTHELSRQQLRGWDLSDA